MMPRARAWNGRPPTHIIRPVRCRTPRCVAAEVKGQVAPRRATMAPGDRGLLVHDRGIVRPNFDRTIAPAVNVGDRIGPEIRVVGYAPEENPGKAGAGDICHL